MDARGTGTSSGERNLPFFPVLDDSMFHPPLLPPTPATGNRPPDYSRNSSDGGWRHLPWPQTPSVSQSNSEGMLSYFAPLTPDKMNWFHHCYSSNADLLLAGEAVAEQMVCSDQVLAEPATLESGHAIDSERGRLGNNVCSSPVLEKSPSVSSHEERIFRQADTSTDRVPVEDEVLKSVDNRKKREQSNMTPKQKIKKKKYWPKVLRDDLPKKTPKPVTPKKTEERKNHTIKRHYVRRRKDSSSLADLSVEKAGQDSSGVPADTCVKEKKKSKEGLSSPDVTGEAAGSNSSGVTVDTRVERPRQSKSVKRSLNFDLNSKPADQFQVFTSTDAKLHAYDTSSKVNSSCFGTESTVKPDGYSKVHVENSEAGFAYDLNHSMSKELEDCIRLPKSTTPFVLPSREDLIQHHEKDSSGVFHPSHARLASSSRKAAIRENLRLLEQKHAYQNNNSAVGKFEASSSGVFHPSHARLASSSRKAAIREKLRLLEQKHAYQNNNSEATFTGGNIENTRKNRNCHVHNCQENGIPSNINLLLSCNEMGSHYLSVPKKKRTGIARVREYSQATSYNSAEKQEGRSLLERMLALPRTMRKKRSELPIRVRSLDFINFFMKQPRNCLDAIRLSMHLKSKTRKRSKMGRRPTGSSMSSLPCKLNFVEKKDMMLAASPLAGCFVDRNYDYLQSSCADSVGKNFVFAADLPRFFQINRNYDHAQDSILRNCLSSSNKFDSVEQKSSAMPVHKSFVEDHQNSKLQASIYVKHSFGALKPYMHLMNDIVPYGGRELCTTSQQQNAIVPYERQLHTTSQQQNAIVPHGEGAMVPIKQKRPLPKVDLDPETTREWKLLMGEEVRDETDGSDTNRRKYWEEEQRRYKGRATSFIERMHLIQGDRRFSQWDGSVTDSVIGVFLTQNVSDFLSSNAFMNLAATFPPSVVLETDAEKDYLLEEQGNQSCVIDDTTKHQEERRTEMFHQAKSMEEKELSNNCASPQSNHKGRSSNGLHIQVEVEMNQETLVSRIDKVVINQESTSSSRTTSTTLDDLISTQCSMSSTASFLGPIQAVDQVGLNSEVLVGSSGQNSFPGKKKASKSKDLDKGTFDWDSLRRTVLCNGAETKRTERLNSVDWEAVRRADVSEISEAIKERGQNNILAQRIKDFLDRLVEDHGSTNLEWLRNVPEDQTKDYLLSIKGLGLKSVECVRLLALNQHAFPVDTNVGRICVRLGWVPLQPMPESVQLHVLEQYPVLASIQKYLWPRLCTLEPDELYELHYQMITFGKVFCTKRKPSCYACPMRGECKHFASKYASARLQLPEQEHTSISNSLVPVTMGENNDNVISQRPVAQIEGCWNSQQTTFVNHEPIIEEPATPEPEYIGTSEIDIEDYFQDVDEIPHIDLRKKELSENLFEVIKAYNLEGQDEDISKAIVMLTEEAASIPLPKLKNVSRLRTEHQVYEIPDSHPLLETMDKREHDDPCPYLLAIWLPGETSKSTQAPQACCNSQETKQACDSETCSSCSAIREERDQIVRGTLMIPCRTANRGAFPLNGTYFQVNEVFADHESSCIPINVPRKIIWNLPRRTVYFGSSIQSIFTGMSTESTQRCFRKGYVCVRGFNRKTRRPMPLQKRFHTVASRESKNKKAQDANKHNSMN